MIIVLDDDPATVAQLKAALDAWARQLRHNGRYPTPDLLLLMRSIAARSGQERPTFAPAAPAPHPDAQPAIDAATEPKELAMTYAQAAQLLGISVRTVRRRVATGELPTVALGPRLRRIPLAAIEDLVRQGPAT